MSKETIQFSIDVKKAQQQAEERQTEIDRLQEEINILEERKNEVE